MRELLTGVLAVVTYFVICASAALLMRFFVKVPDEVFRKTLHFILLGSLAVWISAFDTWWIAAAVSIGFAAVVYPVLMLAEKTPTTQERHGLNVRQTFS